MSKEIAAAGMLMIPFAGALLIPFVNLLNRKWVPWLAVATGGLAAFVALFFLYGPPGDSFSVALLPGILQAGFLFDSLSSVPALIAVWIGFLVLIYSLGYMKHEEHLGFYYSVVLLFIGSMAAMALSDNFLLLFFFWEVMGVCSYLLIGFFFTDPKAANAGMKAFLTTKIGDVGLLAAILLFYKHTGTFAIAGNLAAVSSMGSFTLGAIAFGFILGAMGKSAQVPLHVWLPDAMEAPTTISALIHAATMVNAGVYLLARVSPLISQVPAAQETVVWMGVLTAFLGSFLASFNNDLKRILAYSTISQLGYMIMAIGVGAVFASQFHLFSHAIFKALLFLCAGSVIHAAGTRDIRQMRGLQQYMPVTGITFTAGALALMGVPLLNGFFSKDLILEATLEHHAWLPLIIAVTAAMLTVFYSVRTLFLVFWKKSPGRSTPVHESPLTMTIPLMLLAAGTFSSWLIIEDFSASWNKIIPEQTVIPLTELIKETFTSPAFIFTLSALLAGYLLFRYRSHINGYLQSHAPSFKEAACSGLWFDSFYGRLISFVIKTGETTRYVIDEKIMESINYRAGEISMWLSRTSAKMQTGSLHWNILYILVMLIVMIGVLILW